MNEIIVIVKLDENGKYVANAMGRAISLRADSWNDLKSLAKDEVINFFRNEVCPQAIRFHIIKEEIMALDD